MVYLKKKLLCLNVKRIEREFRGRNPRFKRA